MELRYCVVVPPDRQGSQGADQVPGMLASGSPLMSISD